MTNKIQLLLNLKKKVKNIKRKEVNQKKQETLKMIKNR